MNTCLPKNVGGLNFKYRVDWNIATVLKMLWNIHMKVDKLWIRWINVYYLKGKSIMHWKPNRNTSWMIKETIMTRDLILHSDYWSKCIQQQKFSTSGMYKDIRGNNTQVQWNNIFL